jgi:hypothetical protein
LKVVSVRDVWALEPQHFSTWLADNIEQLGRAIGIELEVRGREVGVGAFSLDMLAHDVDTLGLFIARNDASENRRVYEQLKEDEARICDETGLNLNWDFKEDRIRQQIWTAFPVDRANPEQLQASRQWAIDAAKRFK